MKTAKKTIYKKVLDELKKDSGEKTVFDIEEKIGKAAAEYVLKQKKKEAKSAAAHKSFPDFKDYVLIRLKKNIWEHLQKKFDYSFSFEEPPKAVLADISIPCFLAAKELSVSPVNLSKGVCDFILRSFGNEEGAVKDAVSVGGYVNITLKKERLAKNVLKDIEKLKDFYGGANGGSGKTVIIDYSSPNIAKPMSVGHLRSTIIGNALKNIYEFLGFSVVSVNYLGDWGTQFGKLLTAIELWGEKINPVRNSRMASHVVENGGDISNGINFKKNPIKEFLELYVRFHKEVKENPALDAKAREKFQYLENGDKELVKKWLEICDISVKEFEKIYSRLSVDFNLYLGESFYVNSVQSVVDLCLTNGIAKKDKSGAVVVEFGESELPSSLLKKSDGASIYLARDIAAAIFRVAMLKSFIGAGKKTSVENFFGKIIYVVGNEQNLHFKQLFKILEILKIGGSENFLHIGFGMVSLPDGKMSTREGRGIFLADLLDEAEKRTTDLVKEKREDLGEREIKEIAQAVGTGAILYADLSQFREKNIVFTWNKMLNLKGDSAPYLQYAFARTQSILRKAGLFRRGFNEAEAGETDFGKPELPNELTNEESGIILSLACFPEAVYDAYELGRPDKIANYLNDLVKKFNRFYENVPVLTVEGDMLNFRLSLIKSTGQVIKNGLNLLGVKVVDKM